MTLQAATSSITFKPYPINHNHVSGWKLQPHATDALHHHLQQATNNMTCQWAKTAARIKHGADEMENGRFYQDAFINSSCVDTVKQTKNRINSLVCH